MGVKKARKGAGKKVAAKVSQNVTEKWSEQKERAAHLAVEDRLSDEEIAAAVGVDRRTFARWKLTEQFSQRRATILEETQEALVARGIAEKQNRVDAYSDRWERMRKVIEARGKEMASYAGGGATGLLVRQLKSIGKGEDAQVVEEYAVDTGLLKEMREHEKQAAQELGQWTEKSDITSGGKAIIPPRIELIRSREQVRTDDAGQ